MAQAQGWQPPASRMPRSARPQRPSSEQLIRHGLERGGLVAPPGSQCSVDATIAIATLSGIWRDSAGERRHVHLHALDGVRAVPRDRCCQGASRRAAG